MTRYIHFPFGGAHVFQVGDRCVRFGKHPKHSKKVAPGLYLLDEMNGVVIGFTAQRIVVKLDTGRIIYTKPKFWLKS